MQLYTISGLGADKRVFNYLNLPEDSIHLEWIKPIKNESLEAYSKRLSNGIVTSEPFGIIGVSFGGMIAMEISKHLNPVKTILISSAQTRKQLPRIYRYISHIKIARFLPIFLFKAPFFLISRVFSAKNYNLLRKIMQDTDPKFLKWAVQAIGGWKNTTIPKNILHIHGTSDLLIPFPKKLVIVEIKKGGHFMVVDKAKEVNQAIMDFLIPN